MPAVLELKDKDRVRILAAVATRGASFQALRVAVITASQLLLLAVPLLGIVRVDLWAGHHRLLGDPASLFAALRGFVIAVAVLWGLTFASNIVVGRFFCGWGCPVGYVSRLGEDVELTRRRQAARAVDRPSRRLLLRVLSHALGAAFVAVFVGAIMLWWVDPRVMLEGSLRARLLTGGIFAVLWAGGFGHAFVWRFGFCKSACPIGLYYRYVTSTSPIGIVFRNEPSPCIECGACVKICPVDLDPRALGEVVGGGAEAVPAAGDLRGAVAGAAPRAASSSGGTAGGVARVSTGAASMTTAAKPATATLAGHAEGALYGDAECIRCGDCIEACRMIFKTRAGETPPLRFGRVGRDAAAHEDAVARGTACTG